MPSLGDLTLKQCNTPTAGDNYFGAPEDWHDLDQANAKNPRYDACSGLKRSLETALRYYHGCAVL